MKRFLMIAASIMSSYAVCAQIQQKQIIHIDTAKGHGYEVKFIGVLSQGRFFETPLVWRSAKDTIENNIGWKLPSIGQAKTIWNSLRIQMGKKNITMGNPDWQGLYGLYWTANNSMGDISNVHQIYAIVGSPTDRFGVDQEYDPEPIATKNKVIKLILIRVY